MATSTLRNPAVAGRFYPGNSDELRKEVRSYLSQTSTAPVAALGCIAPHAGYMYSGHVAGAVFAGIEVPRRCVLMGPNHTGQGHESLRVGRHHARERSSRNRKDTGTRSTRAA